MISALFCLVVGITDGDTIKVRCGEPGAYEQVTIRLAEIDAPEKGQAYGQLSRANLSNLCFKQTATVKPSTKDRYGRTVAHVECQGKDAGEEQLRAGLAWVYDKYMKNEKLYALEADARGDRRGLWADKDPTKPWIWRRAKQ